MSTAVTPPATTTSTNVHIEIPSACAMTERGHWDACALVAELDALHMCPWGGVSLNDQAATEAKLVQWRSEYLAAARWTPGGGTTLGNIYWHVMLHAPHLAGYIPYSGAPNLDALHTFVKRQMVAQNPVIIEVSNAAALPHNEAGVQYHFVTLAGIDSTLGYLVLNGDTVDALNSTAFLLPRYWATWAQLVTAGICGAIALDRSWTPPAPPPPPPVTPPPPVVPPVVPIGLADAIAQAEALVTALKAMEATS